MKHLYMPLFGAATLLFLSNVAVAASDVESKIKSVCNAPGTQCSQIPFGAEREFCEAQTEAWEEACNAAADSYAAAREYLRAQGWVSAGVGVNTNCSVLETECIAIAVESFYSPNVNELGDPVSVTLCEATAPAALNMSIDCEGGVGVGGVEVAFGASPFGSGLGCGTASASFLSGGRSVGACAGQISAKAPGVPAP